MGRLQYCPIWWEDENLYWHAMVHRYNEEWVVHLYNWISREHVFGSAETPEAARAMAEAYMKAHSGRESVNPNIQLLTREEALNSLLGDKESDNHE